MRDPPNIRVREINVKRGKLQQINHESGCKALTDRERERERGGGRALVGTIIDLVATTLT